MQCALSEGVEAGAKTEGMKGGAMGVLYEAALKAINRMFEDKTVSKAEAMANLEALADQIELLMESLR